MNRWNNLPQPEKTSCTKESEFKQLEPLATAWNRTVALKRVNQEQVQQHVTIWNRTATHKRMNQEQLESLGAARNRRYITCSLFKDFQGPTNNNTGYVLCTGKKDVKFKQKLFYMYPSSPL
jgi:hypothetical protein